VCNAPAVPAAALVIVNYRSAPDTLACIESVRRTAGDLVGEIVVVDNASGDGSVEALQRGCPQATVVASSVNGGFAAGVNMGVAQVSGDPILVLNPDCQVRDDAVAALVRRLKADPGLGVTGPLLLDGEGTPRMDAYKAWPSLWSLFVSLCLPVGHALMGTPLHPEVLTAAQIEQRHPIARVCGSALAIRRQAWLDAGPMDEGYFMYFEEVDWQQRVVAAGWRIDLTHDARVVHLIQGGEGLETVPLPYLRSAFRFLEARGRSARAIQATVLAAVALSRLTLQAAGLAPGLGEKSRRMRAGYARLAAAARTEAHAAS
jgi:N-acetylglucosaminyl-diphospho-decaprenol L-rhamnosyltransferase